MGFVDIFLLFLSFNIENLTQDFDMLFESTVDTDQLNLLRTTSHFCKTLRKHMYIASRVFCVYILNWSSRIYFFLDVFFHAYFIRVVFHKKQLYAALWKVALFCRVGQLRGKAQPKTSLVGDDSSWESGKGYWQLTQVKGIGMKSKAEVGDRTKPQQSWGPCNQAGEEVPPMTALFVTRQELGEVIYTVSHTVICIICWCLLPTIQHKLL